MGLFDFIKKETPPAAVQWPVAVGAAAKGKVLPMAEIPDPVFSEGVLGQCCGIEPVEGKVYAPVDGKVIQVVESLHALGFSGPGGVEILLHIGVDTVDMNGDGFDSKVKVGSIVKKGQLVLTMDLDKIKAAGHPSTVITAITNSNDFTEVTLAAIGKVEPGDNLFTVNK